MMKGQRARHWRAESGEASGRVVGKQVVLLMRSLAEEGVLGYQSRELD